MLDVVVVTLEVVLVSGGEVVGWVGGWLVGSSFLVGRHVHSRVGDVLHWHDWQDHAGVGGWVAEGWHDTAGVDVCRLGLLYWQDHAGMGGGAVEGWHDTAGAEMCRLGLLYWQDHARVGGGVVEGLLGTAGARVCGLGLLCWHDHAGVGGVVVEGVLDTAVSWLVLLFW